MKFKDIYQEVTALLDVSERSGDGGTLDASAVEVVIAGLNNGMRWLAAKAPVRMLDGSDESGVGTGFLRSLAATFGDDGLCTVALPEDFSRVFRVKVAGWHKAVSEVVEDISDDYLMLSDAVANATADRPVVALVSGSEKRLEIYPGRNRPESGEGAGEGAGSETDGVEVEVVCYPGEIDVDLGVHVGNYDWERVIALPPRVKNALIYYTASLVCMAWSNPLYKELMAMAENALK